MAASKFQSSSLFSVQNQSAQLCALSWAGVCVWLHRWLLSPRSPRHRQTVASTRATAPACRRQIMSVCMQRQQWRRETLRNSCGNRYHGTPILSSPAAPPTSQLWGACPVPRPQSRSHPPGGHHPAQHHGPPADRGCPSPAQRTLSATLRNRPPHLRSRACELRVPMEHPI